MPRICRQVPICKALQRISIRYSMCSNFNGCLPLVALASSPSLRALTVQHIRNYPAIMGDRDMSLNHGKSQVVGTVIDDEVENPIFEHIEMTEHGSGLAHQQVSTIDTDLEENLDESDGSDSDDEEDSPVINGGVELVRPEPKPSSVGHNIVILLFVVGMVIGVVNGCVQWLVKVMSQTQAYILMSSTPGPFFFMCTSAFLVGLSAFIIKAGGEPGTTGSGMAEVKALMVSDFHPTEFKKLVSMKILYLRITSLVTAAGSGLSIGLAAPLVHSAVCFSFWLCKFVPDFGEMMDNPALLKQIFAAAAAVGFGSTANTPVGGLLFSVEVTSAFYLISNYWRSFMAATAGAITYELLVMAKKEERHFIVVDIVADPYQKYEYPFFILLGLICGVLGLYYMKLQQAWVMFIKPHTLKYPVLTACAAGIFTSLMIYATGAFSADGVGPGIVIKDCFNDGYISQLGKYNDVKPVGALFMNVIIRVMLSVIGTTLRISAGIFMCMMCIGSLLGRIFGLIIQSFFDGSEIYVGGYAMVGAVAFASATTHTISAAVIIVEMTGEINMLLPCLIGAVVACGVTKSRSVSLYDQGMMNKGLESFELLLRDTSGYSIAADVLDKKVISVANECTVGELFAVLENVKQSTFPVIDSNESKRLIGSLQRHDIFVYLHNTFSRHELLHYLNTTLPVDFKLFEQHNIRVRKLEARNRWIRKQQEQFSSTGDLESNTHHTGTSVSSGGLTAGQEYSIRKGLFPSPYQLRFDQVDEEGNPVRRKKSRFQRIYSSLRKAAKNRPKIERAFGLDLGNRGLEGPSVDDEDDENVPKKTVEELARESAIIEALLLGKLDISNEADLPLNFSPFTAHNTTTLDQLYILFEMVKVQCVFIVNQEKKLEGMISKHHLLQSLKAKQK